MDRFHVSGWRRWYFVEPVSEGLTLGNAGCWSMLALAIPAFRETSDDDWLKKSELAVTFLDRYGNEVGSRGIRHNDAIPLDQFPDHLIKATLATEDRRFYEHFGIDIPGLFRAMLTNARAGGVVQGGSSISQQLAKNLFLSNERTIERKVKEAFLALWLEVAPAEERDPQALSRPRLSRRRHLRRRCGGAVLFQQVGARREPRRISDAGRPVQGAVEICSAYQSAGGARPRQRRPRQSDRGRIHDRGPGVRRPPQSRDRGRPPRRALAQLLPRLGLRRDEEAGRNLAQVGARARVRRAPRPRRRPAEPYRAGAPELAQAVRPRIQGQAGRRGVDGHRRRGARHGRRPRLQREPVQPRDRCHARSRAPRSSPMSTPPR